MVERQLPEQFAQLHECGCQVRHLHNVELEECPSSFERQNLEKLGNS